MSDDPYAVLGVARHVSEADLKKAYRKLARDNHPDLKPGDAEAEARFKAAAAAYDLLKDPERRARFDRGEIDARGQERPDPRFYRDFAEAQDNPYRRGPEFAQGFDAEELYEHLFGGGRRGQGQRARFSMRGQDARYQMEVDFLDAVNGAERRLTLPDGAVIDVTIPKGVRDGQAIRLRGKGLPGLGEGAPGDALITLSVRPHPLFTREGDDIRAVLPISLDEAVLGGKIEAPTIEGKVRVTVPSGASSGRTLRLKGRGVAGRGDQLIELRIALPDVIDDGLAAFMKGWRAGHAYDPRKEDA